MRKKIKDWLLTALGLALIVVVLLIYLSVLAVAFVLIVNAVRLCFFN